MRALTEDEEQLVAAYQAASHAAVRYAVFAQTVRSRLHLFNIIVNAIETNEPEDDEYAALLLGEISKNREIKGSSAALAEIFASIRDQAEENMHEEIQS